MEESNNTDVVQKTFRPPTAQVLEKSGKILGEGSLEKALQGDYTIDISSIFKEAWELTKGIKGKVWGYLILAYLAMGILLMIPSLLFGGFMAANPNAMAPGSSPPISFLIVLYSVLLLGSAAILPGYFMYPIQRSVSKEPPPFSVFFSYAKYFFPVAALLVLTYILMGIGYLLLVIPGVYLAIAYAFVVPLKLDRSLGIWESMETSRKAVTKKWFSIFGLFLLMGLTAGIGTTITLGIGSIWLVPWSMMVLGVTYRRMFGVKGV